MLTIISENPYCDKEQDGEDSRELVFEAGKQTQLEADQEKVQEIFKEIHTIFDEELPAPLSDLRVHRVWDRLQALKERMGVK